MVSTMFKHQIYFISLKKPSEPFWKPSVTPYVVSFWVRQSLRHAYARRVFPYAKQIEETLTRSPYAALRKWGFCLRQTRYDKALTDNVKEGFWSGSSVSQNEIPQIYIPSSNQSHDWLENPPFSSMIFPSKSHGGF